MKCRFLPETDISLSNQYDGFSNRYGSNGEHGGNNAGSCKDKNHPVDGLKKKNPGALAGATGAAFGKAIFKTETYRNRAASATRLCAAIAECDRDDAVFIMSAALADLRAGSPVPHLLAIEAEAASWASFAAPFELLAYLRACLDRLGDDALKVNARKALLVRLWRALPVADQRAFLRRVDPSGAIQGAAQ